MPLTKVLIAVKTYPTLSAKYDELVCTAGFLEDGSWIRIYPVPFRKMAYSDQYKKYDWIEVDLVKNTKDFRPESFRPRTIDSELNVIGHIDTKREWSERKDYCLQNVRTNLGNLIADAKDKELYTSLAVFKPTNILDFKHEEVEREWSQSKLDSLNQLGLFDTEKDGEFVVIPKLPYKFSYVLEDDEGRQSKMMIEDWEIGQLYWNCYKRSGEDEEKAIADVRKKYFDDFAKTKDLHLFLGTTQAHHLRAKNPFVIIGTFHPKRQVQGSLF